MKLRDLLRQSGVAALDAEMLAAHALGKPRSWITAHDDQEVRNEDATSIQKFFDRRKNEEPVAYITGEKEFYGRTFFVSPDVLIPRPATESLIDLTKEFLAGKSPKTREIDTEISAYVERFNDQPSETILDIGTGSGCIGVTLALEGVKQKIIGIDISEKAIAIAKKNADQLQARNISFIHSDGPSFIENFDQPFFIVSNPPYIPSGIRLEKTVAGYEPKEALFAGKEGMDVISRLMASARGNPRCVGIIMEMRSDQIPFISLE